MENRKLFMYSAFVRRVHCCLVSLLLGAIYLSAQMSPIQQFAQMVTQFEERRPIAYQANYAFYDQLDATSPQHQLLIAITKTKEAVYYAYDQTEVHQTKSQVIYVDHLTKQILVESIPKARQVAVSLSNYTQWMEMLALTGQKVSLKNGQTLLRFLSTDHSQTSMEFYYNNTTELPQQAAIAFDFSNQEGFFPEYDQTKLTVTFSNYQVEKVQIPFVPAQVFTKKGDQLVGVGKYKNYSIELF